MSVDVVVVGAGVIGVATAYHLAKLGAQRVLLLDERADVASGTSAQSSAVLRTHYSVSENVALAQRSLAVFKDFKAYLGDDEADCGFNRCGYLIVADERKAGAVRAALAGQRAVGIAANEISAAQAREQLPLLRTDGLAVFGHEPDAGHADAYLTASAFARAARRLGVVQRLGTRVQALLHKGGRVHGVQLADGTALSAGHVVLAANVWTPRLLAPLGLNAPVQAQRHEVLALSAPQPYLPGYPVFKDMSGPSMLYARSYGRTQVLVSAGGAGPVVDADEDQAEVPLDTVLALGQELSTRLPCYAAAGLASSWTGLYDVTPDWNPVLGAAPGFAGLTLAFGFSGHGFKLSPVVGRLLAQVALGLPTEVSLQPYRWQRFEEGKLLSGAYGGGAVS